MLQDWELKHKDLCKAANAEERKTKGGSKKRIAQGEESLEEAFRRMMSLKNAHVIKGVLTGAKEVCEKKEERRKGKRRHGRLVVKEDKSGGKKDLEQDVGQKSRLGDVD